MTRFNFVNFELQRSVIYQFVCTLQDISNDVVKTTSLVSKRSYIDQEEFLKNDQIYFCQILSYKEVWYINLYVFVRQIQWCDQNHLWTLSLESGRSYVDQKGFLKDDQIYYCKFLSYRVLWYINLYVTCETNPVVWSKSRMDIILGIRKKSWLMTGWIFVNSSDFSNRALQCIKLYVHCETNPMVLSKSLMYIIFGIRKIHNWGWPDLLLSVFKLQRSVI